MNIVLIDDDEDDRKLFFESVREIDETIECIGIENCMNALKYLRSSETLLPDYIFLDLRMPGLSGNVCLAEIRKEAKLAHVPVIVYTTSNEVTDSIALKKLGANHFMSKPNSPDEVYYMVSFVLNEKWT